MYSDMLVILDYSTGKVDIIRMDLKNKTSDDVEEYIESIGYRLKDVSYMITTIDKIRYV